MPGKHDLSDSESSSPPASNSKRPRRKPTLEDGSPLPNSTPPPQTGDEEEEDQMSDIEEQTEQDRQALEEMKATQAIKSTNQKIAEAGVISHVKLENFMCHYSTEVDFGPQVNFLVGVNGSGKSAVLTGITMALGGNAKATNRGTKGGDLIREGQPSARCSVTLANRGEDAFKRDVYGDEITVERTLNKSGGGGYKIKNSEGKTVDTKKATLDAFLDHFNLQVDNPMTVLTQDQSRQFLAKASAKDKYNFFLRGTQLAQLTEEYEQIRSNTETMEEALARKREVVPELKEAYRRAKERAKEAQAAMEQQENLGLLKDQLVWSYVEEVETQIQFARHKIQEEAAKGPKFEYEINKLQEELDTLQGEISTAKEAEAESKNAADQNKPELEALKEKIRLNRVRLQRWKDEERKISSNMARQRATLRDLEQQIAIEESKLSRDIEAERAPLRAAIEHANDELAKIDLRVNDNTLKLDQCGETYRTHSEEYSNINAQIQNAEQQKQQLGGRLNNIRMAARNKLLKFGSGVPQFLEAIKNERGWRGQVVGPMGLNVQLNHPEYARALDSFFNHYLNGFVCSNQEDARRLRQLCSKYRMPQETIILCVDYDENFDRDLAHGEPDSQILTVLRALTIDSPLVRQALINSNQLEKIALVPRRPDGDALMRTDPRNVSRTFSADMYQLRHSNGKSSSNSMDDWRGAPRLQADASQSIASLEEQMQKIDIDIRGLEQRKAQVGQLARAADQQRKSLDGEIRKLSSRKLRLQNEIAANTEKLTEEQPNNISALLSAKAEIEAEIENIQRQYQAGLENKASQDQDLRPDVEKSNQLQNDILKAESLAARIAVSSYPSTLLTSEPLLIPAVPRSCAQSHLSDFFGKVRSVEAKIHRQKTDKDAHINRLAKYQAEAQAFQDTLTERTDQASTICQRPEIVGKKKDAKRLEKEIESINKALKERAKRQGATLEQILEELEVRKKVAQDAVKQTNDLAVLINQLEQAYNNRTAKWTDFRAHICHRAKMQFGFYLSNRGYHGKLKFDHDRTQLHLAVQTDADKGKEKQKRKDAQALSGGEKSFSTICLLLTMWEAVGCPLRCLDEFDVFMDAVNRRIAMNMMIDTAKSADAVQFVLITPQDMGSIAWGKEVKVVKMGDPKRNKGALAAGR
ncbi:hypothetical protein JCM16303_007304 [Sporobolomyces ruberrimus]